MDVLLRVDDVATALGIKPATVRLMIRRQQLLVVRPTAPRGRAVRVPESAVEALISNPGASAPISKES